MKDSMTERNADGAPPGPTRPSVADDPPSRAEFLNDGIKGGTRSTQVTADQVWQTVRKLAQECSASAAVVRFDSLFEGALTEYTAKDLFAELVERALPNVLNLARKSPGTLRMATRGRVASVDEFKNYRIAWESAKTTPCQHLGQFPLPEAMGRLATAEMVRTCLLCCQHPEEAGESESWRVALTLMEQLCRYLGEPSKDMFGAQVLVVNLAVQGRFQDARNIAEDVLQHLTETQPEFATWRKGLAWWVYSGAFFSSNNWQAAMRYIILALAAWQEHVLEAEPVVRVLGCVSRICMMCALSHPPLEQLAKTVINQAIALSELIETDELTRELQDVSECMAVQTFDPSDRRKLLHNLLKCWKQVRKLSCESKDENSLLRWSTMLAQYVCEARVYGVEVPSTMCSTLAFVLTNHLSLGARTFSLAVRGNVTRDEFLRVVEFFDSALRETDLGVQTARMHDLARQTAQQAAAVGDPDLFLTTSAVLAQPVMDRAQFAPPNMGFHRRYHRLIKIARRRSLDGADSVELGQWRDRIELLGKPPYLSILPNCTLTTASLADVLRPHEAALLVVPGMDGRLAACLVRPGSPAVAYIMPGEGPGSVVGWGHDFGGMPQLGPNVWDGRSYRDWRAGYGGDHRTTRAEARKTHPFGKAPNDMGIYVPVPRSTDIHQLIVIPSADLFGFEFTWAPLWHFTESTAEGVCCTGADFQLPESGPYLGCELVTATAPSAAWLVNTRKFRGHHTSERRAWLGVTSTHDRRLKWAQRTMQKFLSSFQFSISQEARPASMAGAGLVLLVVHGHLDGDNQFSEVDDGVSRFKSNEVADWLHGCGCVVLCVCHGGLAAPANASTETRGLVSSILGAGVRAVIASPWQLPVPSACRWVKKFIERAVDGHQTVGSAAFPSGFVNNGEHFNGVDWAIMNVYGDPEFRIPQS